MKTNMGSLDTMLRTVIAFTFANLALDSTLAGQFITVYWIITLFMGVTAFTGFCPLYALLHIDSIGKRHEHRHE